jgi:nucleotide-binding universal stress UspA family protein
MFKHILVPVDGSPLDGPALSAALGLARSFGAHVEALHVRWDPRQMAPLAGTGLTADMLADILEESDRMLAEAAANARRAFDQAAITAAADMAERPPGAHGATAWWREVIGRPDRMVVQQGRFADLLLFVQAPGNPSRPSLVETALFETGRPLLLVPPRIAADDLRSVAVAWNGSPAAVRAVAAAMPFLQQASIATILTVPEGGSGRGATPGEAAQLAEHLAWHGIKALVRPVDRGGRSVGEALTGEAQDLGAGLLVMGGYGHSRFRETILGGATRHVTDAALDCAVFMVH